MRNTRINSRLIIISVVVLLAVALRLPPVWSRVTYHTQEVYRTVKYWIKPPSEAVFVPSTLNEDATAIPAAVALATEAPTQQAETAPEATPTQPAPEPTAAPTATPTHVPTPTPAPLPPSVVLSGILCEQQGMNNCGPATLSMYLSFYDWGKTQKAAAAVLKPNLEDVNVMPYELVNFVNENTELKALWRYGGDLQTIRNLIAAGFPVMIEKSFEPYDLRNQGWMGHYNLVVGYNDQDEILTVHDSYLMIHPPWGIDIPPSQWDTFVGFDFYYSDLEQAWRSFNFVFVVVYPPEKENDVLSMIGPLASEEEACRIAYDRAMQETTALTDIRDQYFAWFNVGTSLDCLKDYTNAADAFDKAFAIYPEIRPESRPYRILWYEHGPYSAYYHVGRYQDVIDLASQTLGYMADPILEESYYWRAMSYNALGDTRSAINDLRASLKHHPGFAPSEEMLVQLGQKP